MSPAKLPVPVLPYESPVYEAHQMEIDALISLAERLGVLQDKFRDGILGPDGIVCDRMRGDEMPCVSRSYFGLAKNLKQMNSSEDPWSLRRKDNRRELIEGVLAMRFSILDCLSQVSLPDVTPFEVYRDLIAELEDYCFQQGIPSVLPNMLAPASLFTRLQDEVYDLRNEKIKKFYEKLAELCAWQDHHLHTIVTNVQRQGDNEFAIELVCRAAEIRTMDVTDLFRANLLLAETFICSLYDLSRYEDVLQSCEDLGEPTVVRSTKIMEKLLRSYLQKFETELAKQFIERHSEVLLNNSDRSLGIALKEACLAVAWSMHSSGEDNKAPKFLTDHLPYVFMHDEDVRCCIDECRKPTNKKKK